MDRALSAATIRPARAGDLDALQRLENAAFSGDRLSRRSLRYFLSAARTTDVPVAEDEAGPVGYAMVGYRAGSTIGRVFSLAVDVRMARRGIGAALLRACEAAARARGKTGMRLEVRADNPAAIALYIREGYARTGEEADYYEDGTAAFRFAKIMLPDVS